MVGQRCVAHAEHMCCQLAGEEFLQVIRTAAACRTAAGCCSFLLHAAASAGATYLLSKNVLCVYNCRDTYVKEEPGESPNDRNDRAIRVAAKW